LTGGFALAASRVWGKEHEIVSFVEIDPFCQKVLQKHWPDVPVYGDIKTYEHNETTVDLLTGGFPCQGFSVAGKQRGKKDPRYLWPEMLAIIKMVRPNWIIGENVEGIVKLALDTVLSDLESEGYTCQSFIIPACAVDAPHRRNRVWIVAYTEQREQRECSNPDKMPIRRDSQERPTSETCRSSCKSEVMADTDRNGTEWNQSKNREGRRIEQDGEDISNTFSQYDDGSGYGSGSVCGKQSGQAKIQGCGEWLPEPSICELDNGLPSGLVRYRGRVATGVKDRVNKLKALGNAICPQVVVPIMEAIKEIDYAKRHTANSRYFR